jgi:molecular chaperone GrpE
VVRLENREQENLDAVNEVVENVELEKCQLELSQWKESMLRVSADFENFKKRTAREKMAWIEEAQADVILRVLEIVDNFDRAFKQPKADHMDANFKIWLQGFEMIHKALYDLLARYEVKTIANDLPFDPQFHEAISQVDSNMVPSGEIVDTVQKGFMIKERVLRVAKVVVAK